MAPTASRRVFARMWVIRPTVTGMSVLVGVGVAACLAFDWPLAWALVPLVIVAVVVSLTAVAEIRLEDLDRDDGDDDDPV